MIVNACPICGSWEYRLVCYSPVFDAPWFARCLRCFSEWRVR